MKNSLVIFDHDGVLVDSEIVVHPVEKSIEIFTGIANKDLVVVIQKDYGDYILD